MFSNVVLMNMSAHGSETTKWQRRKDDRPEEIILAALDLFVEKGYAATRMLDVARKAGVSKGTLYLYFENKEAIFRAAVEQLIVPRISQLEALQQSHQGSCEALIKKMLMGWWQSVWHSRLSVVPKLLVSESGNFPELARYFTENVVKRVRLIFMQIIEQGIRKKEFIDQDALTTARLLMAPIIQAAVWKYSFKAFDDEQNPDEYIRQHLHIFLKGIQRETNRGTL